MSDITEMSITEAALAGLAPIDFGYKRIAVIDDSWMYAGFEAFNTFINDPGALTEAQKHRLQKDGVRLA